MHVTTLKKSLLLAPPPAARPFSAPPPPSSRPPTSSSHHSRATSRPAAASVPSSAPRASPSSAPTTASHHLLEAGTPGETQPRALRTRRAPSVCPRRARGAQAAGPRAPPGRRATRRVGGSPRGAGCVGWARRRVRLLLAVLSRAAAPVVRVHRAGPRGRRILRRALLLIALPVLLCRPRRPHRVWRLRVPPHPHWLRGVLLGFLSDSSGWGSVLTETQKTTVFKLQQRF
jgi:hypothetical protein